LLLQGGADRSLGFGVITECGPAQALHRLGR